MVWQDPIVWLSAAVGVALIILGRVLDARDNTAAGAVLFYCGLACVPLVLVLNQKTRP